MNKYLVLDTNSIVSFFENGFSIANPKGTLTPPESIETLKNLWRILKENKITLIIPEIVVLECERIMSEKLEELNTLHTAVTNNIQNAVTLNRKISSESSNLIEKTIKLVNKKEKIIIEKAWKLINRIVKHKNTKCPKIEQEVMVSAYMRGLMGRKPFMMKYTNTKLNESKPIYDIQPDCVVVESVRKFIYRKTDFELYFCTNDSNFYETNDKKVIDADIKRELNIKESFLCISDFLDKVFRIKPKIVPLNELKEFDVYPVTGEKSVVDGGINIDSGMVKNFESSVK